MLIIKADEQKLDLLKKALSHDRLRRQEVLEMLNIFLKCLLKEALSQRELGQDELLWKVI